MSKKKIITGVSAKMALPFKVNFNVTVRVKLTEAGKKILFHPKNFWKRCSDHWDEKTGCYTSELWDVMRIFTDGLHMEDPVPFENNEIEFLSVF